MKRLEMSNKKPLPLVNKNQLMDLFEFDDDDMYELSLKVTRSSKRKKKKYTPLNSFKLRLALYKEFATAIQQRDERLLTFLLSDKQESKHWTTKQDFIDKYLNACNNFEARQPITINVHSGIGRNSNSASWQSGVTVIVDSTKKKERLWKFDLLFSIDEFSKIKITKARAVYSSSAFKGQPTNEIFKELPHPSCSPPKPKFSFK